MNLTMRFSFVSIVRTMIIAVVGAAMWDGVVSAATVLRGPYLQQGTSTSIIVRWRTDGNVTSEVRFGTNISALNSVFTSIALTNEHEITLTGMTPGTKYFYTIGTTNGAYSDPHMDQFFLTAPIAGTVQPVRVWVIGDSGTGNMNQKNVRDAYYNFATNRHTDIWLMLGDNAYELGTDSEYQAAVFDVYGLLLRKTVLWPTLGNHDTAFETDFVDTYPYFAIFSLPAGGEAGGVVSGTEHYYSFDYANIHFICLDSMTADRTPTGAMATWLQADLDSTTNTWIIAFWHHPPYSRGSHDSDTETELIEMRETFLPILESGGVDIVLTGHSHSYERSFLIDGFYGYSMELSAGMLLDAGSGRTNDSGAYTKSPGFRSRQGAVYAVVGCSGANLGGGPLNHPAMFISLNQFGSLVLDIHGNRLDAKFLRETGAIQDYFTILKTNPQFEAAALNQSGQFESIVTGVAAGKTNVIQASTNLINWIPVATNVASSNLFLFTDPDAGRPESRFYRLIRLP